MKTRALIWFAVASSSAGIAAVLSGCPSFASDVGPFPDGGSDGASNDGAPQCDPSKDPSCVNDSSGIFVSSGGSDSNAGTKEAPVKTIGAAIAKTSSSKNAVYVCAGTYAEHVKITSAVSLYGGFACADWTYATTNKPKVAPSDAGYALDIESVSGAIAVQDLEFDSIDGKNAGDSSVAIFVANSSSVALHRVTATAGNGLAGSDAAATTNYDPGVDAGVLKGNNGSADVGGAEQDCTGICFGIAHSIGGKGGNGDVAAPAINGADGGPPLPPNPDSVHDGRGGVYAAICVNGDPGATASPADGGAPGALANGSLGAAGWTRTDGMQGATGSPGQGGGGGSGALTGGADNGGGGGGACGGCGGAGGASGMSGGSSFALLVFQSTVTVDTCTLTAGNGADGKAGGGGQGGQTGGGAGSPASIGVGCPGANGGTGGAGAGGGGGAGGNAIALGYAGTKPSVTSTTYVEGTAGGPGAGGTGGAGNNGLAGAAGMKADVQELP